MNDSSGDERPAVVVIGGGAAGFFAAIRCAESHPGARVLLLEATRRVLTKVRISGGGRCNVTHNCFEPSELVRSYPRGAKELRGPFSRFQPRDTVGWFSARGVELKTEADGRMFPVTDSSETVAQCLEQSAARVGVVLRTGTLVQSVTRSEGGGFVVGIKGGDDIKAKALILATGSALFGYDLVRGLGHTVTPLVPSLFTFNVDDPRLRDLAGVSFPKVHLELALGGLEREGPLLITHWGLSGPAVLKLSAFGAALLHEAGYRAKLTIGFVPGVTVDSAAATLRSYKDEHPKRSIAKNVPFDLPKRFWQRLVEVQGVSDEMPWAEAPKRLVHALAEEVAEGRYEVCGKGVFKEEFVTAGGVSLKEVDFRTMESRLVPGLYFAGELLDVDGITGGFNFQNAWTTGWIAGGGCL